MTDTDTAIPAIWRGGDDPPQATESIRAFVRLALKGHPAPCYLRPQFYGETDGGKEGCIWHVDFMDGSSTTLDVMHSWMPRDHGQSQPAARAGGATDPSIPVLLPGPFTVHGLGVYRQPHRGVSSATSSRGGKVAEAITHGAAFTIAQHLNDHARKSAKLEDLREHLAKLGSIPQRADFATASIPRPEDVLARLREWAQEARRIIDA